MSKKGRHTFVIPKSETPTLSPRTNAIENTDIQQRLRTLGHYSRQASTRAPWPSKPDEYQ